MSRTALVVGASGAIGSAIVERLVSDGLLVWQGRRSGTGDRLVVLDPERAETYANLADLPALDAVVWAQGVNANDSIADVETAQLRHVLEVNTMLVIDTMHALVAAERLAPGARLCIVSSVWQIATRRNKLSYTVSKAALDGVVRSAAADLAQRGILVNAVLPGVLDTPMTRQVLSPEQIAVFENATGFGRLVSLHDVTNTVSFLCSERNTGVTGQSIAVDLGFGHERNL